MDEPIVNVLGLRGFALVGAEEVNGELVSVIETTQTLVGCPSCGSIARPKDRRTVSVRDLGAGGRPVLHRWRKRVWSCPDPDCTKKTWTEQSWLCRPRKVLTERARTEICRSVGQDVSSVAREARRFGVGWHCAHAAVQDVGRVLVEDPQRTEGVRQVGLDETVYLHARRQRRRVLVTGVVDVESGRLLDVFEGREAGDLRRWMRAMPTEWLDRIEVVSVDPHEGYRSAIVKPDPLTGRASAWAKATIVVDPFHVVRLGNEAVTKCRQRVQQTVLGHRGWKGDPLYSARRVLLLGAERLDDRGWERLHEALRLGDPEDEVLDAWVAKEKVRSIYLTDDVDEARVLLDDAVAWCSGSGVREVKRLGKLLQRWHREILAHHSTGASNGPTEAVNLTIKAVKRRGRGFRNFSNYRLRLLLASGVPWRTQHVTRLRGRRPRLIA